MHSNYIFVVVALFSAHLNALPLNINLGAYSPALVVGDGEISFGSSAAQAAAPAPAAPAAPITTPPAAAQDTSLQGIGKEISPRALQLHSAAQRRDMQGFNAALNYASAALKMSPEVQLGTGEGGSGIGITQKAGGTVSPAPAGGKEVAARDLFSPKMKTTVTTMYVRGGALPVRDNEDSPVERREPTPSSSTIDGINLNMAEGQVAELTFVETAEVDDDDE
ncbi:uncharacterized protein L3040_002426 [Drepanopeziza brunnea f. sp. 'multigermtubi']|uniref:uncharacterized protein n=1 Tax=Drepanopeziza brunnea f. sp. 'multigermtubi' TaxID=698441 RepID=UPI0023A10CBB|nr:hypothetical protein L3040_002426 [Drepanopeziza brunnea f. sp. 'multigermtubi']